MLDLTKTYRTANGEFTGIKLQRNGDNLAASNRVDRPTDWLADGTRGWPASDATSNDKWHLVAEDDPAAKVDVTKIRPGDQVTITGRVIQVDSVEPRIAVRWQEDRTNWLDTRYLEIASHVPGPAYEPKIGDRVTWDGGAVDYYVASIDGDTVSLASAPPCLTKKISDLRQVSA